MERLTCPFNFWGVTQFILGKTRKKSDRLLYSPSPNPGEQEKQARSSHCLESLQTVKWDQNLVNILAAELFHFVDVFFGAACRESEGHELGCL